MDVAVVAREIAVLLVVVAAGAATRWTGVLDDAAARRLARLVVDVAMPALVFGTLVETTDAAALAARGHVPLLGAGLLLLAWGVARLVATPIGGSRTFVFAAGLPNWIYLPLPIAEAALGDDGVRDVLLINAGAMPLLWTAGVAVLGGTGLRALVSHPGVLATVAAVVVVWIEPSPPGPPAVWAALGGAVARVGELTIPLSLLLTGAQLAAAPWRPSPAVAAVAITRLFVAPLVTVAVLAALAAAGAGPDAALASLLVLVAAMPVAISAGMFAERFGGDVTLASQAVAWTTPLSLVTVPLVLEAARRLGVA